MLTQLSTFVAAQQIIDVFRWVVPYSGPKEFEARVGDTIVFRWAQGGHNVYIHPSMSCDLEGAIFVGATPGTPYTFTEADGSPEGTDMFFSCDIGNGAHCQAGQSITVTVFSDPASVSDEPVVVDDAPNATVVEEPVIAEEAPNTTMVDEPVVDEPAVDEPAVDEPVVADEAAPTDTSVVDEPAVTDEAAPTEATEMPAEDVETADTDVDAAEGASGGRANSVASLVGLAFACLAFVLV